MAHFFLVLISIPLSGCTRVNLSIHLLKDILVPSKFGQLWISCYKHPCSGFCKDIMWSQVGLRKHHYEQSWWRWWNPSWAISNPKRWCCESAALNMPANLENSAVATELEKVSFHSNPKERQCQRMFKLPHSWSHLTCWQSNVKILQVRLQ